MSAKSIISTVLGFLAHHVTDLNNLSDALSSVTAALPIDSQDKERIAGAIADLKNSADNIEAFLTNNQVVNDAGEVTVKESDIENAVKAVLPDLVTEAVTAYLEAHPVIAPSTEGNATNG